MEIEIRDNRQKEWFWLDNEYLNGYARILGASCTVVYLSLCRHSDNQTQKCFPSMKLIAEENGISRDTVMRALKKLEEWGIVVIEKSKKNDGTQANNQYTLTAKSTWKSKPSSIEQHGSTESQNEAQPSRKTSPHRVAPEGYNNTHINNTHINNTAETSSAMISSLIELFININPACKSYYGNKTQRQACQDLIDSYTFEEVKNCIVNVLPKTNGRPYFPTIATPVQLRDKWVMLKGAVQKKKNDVVGIVY